MRFINIHINIQIFTYIDFYYIYNIKLANKLIYRYTIIKKKVILMKQKCMLFLFKLGLSLFTPDYMSQGREVDEHQERDAL